MLSRRCSAALLLLFAAISASNAFAKPIKIKWIGTTGFWSDPTQWDLGVVPNNKSGKSYNVFINSVPFQTDVMVNTSNTINGLFVEQHNDLSQFPNSTMIMTSLTNNGSVDVNGNFIVHGNVINTMGNLYLNTDGIGVGRYMLVTGSVKNNGELSVASISGGFPNGVLAVRGTLYNSGRLDLVDGTVNLHSVINTGIIQTHFPENMNVINIGTLTNSGTLDQGFGSFSDTDNIGTLNNLSNGNISFASNLSSNVINNAGALDILDVPFMKTPTIGSLYNSSIGNASISGYDFFVVSVKNAGFFSVNETPISGFPDATISKLRNLQSGTFQLGGIANIKTLINAGTVEVGASGTILRTASLANLGNITISPGGQIIIGTGPDVIGGLTQYANGIWNEQLSATSFGVMDVNGPMSLNGTLDIMLLNGFLPAAGESFDIVNFTPGMLSGMWATVLGRTFDHGLFFWNINYDNPAGEIILTATPAWAENSLLSSTQDPVGQVPEPATWLMMLSGVASLRLCKKAKRVGTNP